MSEENKKYDIYEDARMMLECDHFTEALISPTLGPPLMSKEKHIMIKINESTLNKLINTVGTKSANDIRKYCAVILEQAISDE